MQRGEVANPRAPCVVTSIDPEYIKDAGLQRLAKKFRMKTCVNHNKSIYIYIYLDIYMHISMWISIYLDIFLYRYLSICIYQSVYR